MNRLHLLDLEPEVSEMLAGGRGPATQIAARILVDTAPLYGATSLLSISRSHLDGVILSGSAGLAFAERLAELGATVAVPTTLNVMSMDRQRWARWGQDPDFANRARRLGEAYLRMGARPTFTCAPYQTADVPHFGEQIAWSESNAVAYANSVIGARTNRYGDYLDVCCAITGHVPAAGLHLDEPRLATVQVTLLSIPAELFARDDFYPVLGYALGALVTDEVLVVDGLDGTPGPDQLKALLAAAASSGSIAMLHIVGITPEAATLAQALGHRAPVRALQIGMPELRRARAQLTTASNDDLDVVAFGSPHCSLAECRTLASLMRGQHAAPSVDVFVTTSRAVRDLLHRSGELQIIEEFGARVTADTCIVVAPLVRRQARILMTNSAKYAHYGPGILGVSSVFGSTAACVESAILGRVVSDLGPWAA